MDRGREREQRPVRIQSASVRTAMIISLRTYKQARGNDNRGNMPVPATCARATTVLFVLHGVVRREYHEHFFGTILFGAAIRRLVTVVLCRLPFSHEPGNVKRDFFSSSAARYQTVGKTVRSLNGTVIRGHII